MKAISTAADEPPTPRFAPLGDAALLVFLDGCGEANRDRSLAFAAACRAQLLDGVTDVVCAFGCVGVYFDPAVLFQAGESSPMAAVTEWTRERLMGAAAATPSTPGLHTLPVCYDEPYCDDLAAIAEQAGMDGEELIERHSGVEYRVGAVGFAPGFAYLEGLPRELQTPRRPVPRTRVPAGAVAIGGRYTAVYPNASPGGWNVIGRCPATLFSPHEDPPSILQTGDRVRFERFDRQRFSQLPSSAAPAPQPEGGGRPVLRVVSAGVQSSLQDLGRVGVRQWGVAAGGAMDTHALRLANALIENAPDAVALEAALVGPVLECVSDCLVAVAGGTPAAIGGARRLLLRSGDRLDMRGLTSGRAYVAVRGGFVASHSLSGRGTDLQAGFGGHEGRALKAGDLLRHDPPAGLAERPAGEWFVGASTERPVRLRVVRGPHFRQADASGWRAFTSAEHRVSAESNRMGVRLTGPKINVAQGADAASLPMAPGAIQVPPGGEPIILAVDCQTLGGYPVVGCVASVDLPILAQLRPAESVRFSEVSLAEAERLRSESESQLAAVLAGVALANGET